MGLNSRDLQYFEHPTSIDVHLNNLGRTDGILAWGIW